MMKFALLPVSALCLVACGSRAATEPSHSFVGCWQSDDGMSREVWTSDPSGWLFGYALDRTKDGAVSFFEQTRIEPKDGGAVFVVIGAQGDIVRFEREDTDNPSEYRFMNAEHDYPQVITYTPSAGRLDAQISMLDGSKPVPFKKSACDA